MGKPSNSQYYWDNGMRVNVSRGKMESSMSRFYKHGTRRDFDFTIVDRQAEFAIKKQTENMQMNDALRKLQDLFED